MKLTYLGYAQQTPCHDNSDVQIPLSENTWKRRGFAYVKVPRDVSDELLKLHGTEFKGKILVIEKAKTPAKKHQWSEAEYMSTEPASTTRL